MSRYRGVGWIFVPALIAALVLAFSIRAQASECVVWGELCVPAYTVRWLPAAPPTPQNVAVVTSEDVARTIVEHFWPAWAVDRMMRIAECESHYSPTAVNPTSGAAGIWQIMPGWQRTWPGDYQDPWVNGAVAYQIWLVQGFDAWVCK